MSFFQKTVKRQVLELPIGEISPNPHQPRQEFGPEELAELALSISQVGILQPLSVRRTAEGWELIAGERRLLAWTSGRRPRPCGSLSTSTTSPRRRPPGRWAKVSPL